MATKSNKKPKKLKTLYSTQMWSPIRDIKDGIIITKEGRFVKVMEFAPINFGLLPADEQDKIADAFGNAIRTFPNKFHIKILSRKADIDSHVRTVERNMAKEKNLKCREMQAQTIQQIKRDSISGVSKRFFISYGYNEQSSLHRPSWPEIYSALYEQGRNIASLLSSPPCNNEPLASFDDSTHALDILYNCMCRKEAEYKSLEDKIHDVLSTYVAEHDYSLDSGKIIPINEYISPQHIDPGNYQHICVDGKYYCFGYIFRNAYSTRCRAGWLTPLIRMGEGIDIDIFVEQEDIKKVQSELTYSMQLSHSDYYHKGSNSADLVALENKIVSEQYIRHGITNDQNFHYFSIMVSVADDSAEAAMSKYRAVKDHLTAYGLDLRPLNGNHDLALRSSLPLCDPDPVVTRFAKRNILSGDFGAFYPFTSHEINDPGGIQIGRNKENNSPLYMDLFNRTLYNNGNMVILGSSGSGKTYLVQLIALRLRQQGKQVIIIAPKKGHEYRRACEAIGGTFITIAPGSKQNINIMEIRQHSTDTQDALYGEYNSNISLLQAKIQQIRKFFTLRKKDITDREDKILDDALQATYRAKGITEKNKSLYDPKNPTKFKEMPTLGDLDRELAKFKDSTGLRDALSRFVSGSCASFNAPTNVNLDNDYIVIDVSNMPAALMPEAIFIANDFAYDSIQADILRSKAVILDEASRLIGPTGTEDAAAFVLEEAKMIRGFGGILIVATQDTNDYFALKNGFYGQGILANSKVKIIMKQEDTEIPILKEKLLLPEEELKLLTDFQRGEGLLIANKNHIEMKVVGSISEHPLITTDTEELRQIVNSKKEANNV